MFIENTKTPNPFLVVLQGTKRVDKALVREARGLRRQPMLAPADIAHGITGYEFGGTSPFGILSTMPCCIASLISACLTLGTVVPNLPVILDQDVADIKGKVYINAGSTTLMAHMDVAEIVRLLSPQIAQVVKAI